MPVTDIVASDSKQKATAVTAEVQLRRQQRGIVFQGEGSGTTNAHQTSIINHRYHADVVVLAITELIGRSLARVCCKERPYRRHVS